MEKRILKTLLCAVFTIAFAFAGVQAVRAASGDVDPTNKWAWGTNIGWVNFNPTYGGVSVYEDHLEGYAWGENIGWIRLGAYTGGGAHTYANDAATTYGVNIDGAGNLSGYAWGSNIGWINFNPTHGGLTVDPITGKFDGYAWAENVGWISFKGGSGAKAYRVEADFPPAVQSITRADPNPTAAASLNFTVTFSEAVSGVDDTDFTLTPGGAVSGASVTSVVATADPAVYTVTVDSGSGSGTLRLDLIDDDSILDTSSRPLGDTGSGNGDFTSGEAYTIEKTLPGVTIEQGAGQPDPTNTSPIIFEVTFSKVVTGFDNSDIDITGMAASPTVVVTDTGSGDTYTVSVSGMADGETVTASIPQGVAQDYLGNNNAASTASDNSVTYDTTGLTIARGGIVAQPSGAVLQDLGAYIGRFTRLEITFTAGANNPSGSSDPDDVTNPDNYLLIQSGPDAIYNTTSCLDVSNNGGAVLGDDVQIPTGPVVYNPESFTAKVVLNNGVPLPYGKYRLFLCGTTSITDLAGNPLNDGVDTVLTFKTHSVSEIPDTGFAPGRMTLLPAQPSGGQYTALGDLWLEIPSLGVKQDIVGVSWKEGAWDISWLGSDIGYLDGTAFPTWEGNTVLTGHVYNENGLPGPFVNLGDLNWGDPVSIHAWGRTYNYQVRTVQTRVDPSDTRLLTQSEMYDWITLVTCHGYDEQTGAYRWRTVVRAVLIDITPE